MRTIKALLVSSGDTTRSAKACDCATQSTLAKATALKKAGYECVRRYLTGFVRSGIPKNLTAAELSFIFDAGQRVFPFYQDGGYKLEHFDHEKGHQ